MTHTDSPTPPQGAIRCSCGAWWTGLSRAHCAAPQCHRTFSGDSAAEQHRRGPFGPDRHCADPASVGLVARQMPYGVLWSWPAADGDRAEQLAVLRGAA